jgi:transposase-like protein
MGGMNENAEALAVAPISKSFQATVEEKTQWARRFFESGLSIRRFSAQHGLPRMSLWRWVKKVKKARDEAVAVRGPERPAFTEIKLLPSVESRDWAAELSLPNGKVLRFSKEVPASMLEQLLRLC